MKDDNNVYVNWGRYDAEHQEVLRRLSSLEQVADRMRDDEILTNSLKDRVTDLEGLYSKDVAGDKARRERAWVLALTLLSGVVAPLAVTALIAWLHIRGGS